MMTGNKPRRIRSFYLCLLMVVCLAGGAMAGQAIQTVGDGGTGPYSSVKVEDSGLPVGHKIFRPDDLSPFGKKNPLPVLICAGVAKQGVLSEIASQSFFNRL